MELLRSKALIAFSPLSLSSSSFLSHDSLLVIYIFHETLLFIKILQCLVVDCAVCLSNGKLRSLSGSLYPFQFHLGAFSFLSTRKRLYCILLYLVILHSSHIYLSTTLFLIPVFITEIIFIFSSQQS